MLLSDTTLLFVVFAYWSYLFVFLISSILYFITIVDQNPGWTRWRDPARSETTRKRGIPLHSKPRILLLLTLLLNLHEQRSEKHQSPVNAWFW